MKIGERETLSRTARRAATALAFTTLACGGAQQVSLGPMLAEARSNDLAAVAKYRKQRLVVSGTVISNGLRPVEILVARHTDPPFGYPTTTAAKSTAQYPYVYVADPSSPGPDRILCYFAPDHIEQAAKLVPGTAATLEGTFQEFGDVSGHLELILKKCELE